MIRRASTALLLALLVALAAACAAAGPAATPAPTPTAPRPAFTPKVAPPTAVANLPPAGPAFLLVGNTGGDGVWLRRTPAMSDRLRAWPDNTPMQVIGADRQAEGRVWKNVQDPAGNAGWIPAEFLVAPAPTASPRSAAEAQAIASEAACLRPSRAFMDYLANGLNFPGGAVAGVQAVQVAGATSKDQVWYLVGAAIFGSSRGKEVTGLWATTIDPRGEIAAGTMVAANTVAGDLSVWPLPAQGSERFAPTSPDVRRVEQCLKIALDR